jgi:tRNA(fMet)-specific endonuclease VapC
LASLPALLDTSILISLLRANPKVLLHAQAYLVEHNKLSFSLISQFEVKRGLLLSQAIRQQAQFQQVCADNLIVPLTEPIIELAAELYADLYRQGQLIDDADILIAATALIHGYRLITDNVRHFARIPNLVVENWLSV